MKLFTCGFIRIDADNYLHQYLSLKNFFKKFPDENKVFKASEGWLHKWKTYCSIHQLKVNDCKLSIDEVEVHCTVVS